MPAKGRRRMVGFQMCRVSWSYRPMCLVRVCSRDKSLGHAHRNCKLLFYRSIHLSNIRERVCQLSLGSSTVDNKRTIHIDGLKVGLYHTISAPHCRNHEAFQRVRFSVNGLLPQLLDAQARKEHRVLGLHADSVKIPAIFRAHDREWRNTSKTDHVHEGCERASRCAYTLNRNWRQQVMQKVQTFCFCASFSFQDHHSTQPQWYRCPSRGRRRRTCCRIIESVKQFSTTTKACHGVTLTNDK